MAFGVTLLGFVKKSLLEIKADLEGAFRAEWGASTPVHPESRNGQLIGILSERFAELWDLGQAIYSSGNPDTATGVQLDEVAAITGTIREDATKSTVDLIATGVPGTVLSAGRVASVDGTGVKFETVEDGTIAAAPAWVAATLYAVGAIRTNSGKIYLCTVGGTSAGSGGPTGTGTAIVDNAATWRYLGDGTGYVELEAEAQETGPKVAAAFTVTTIDTPVSQWNNVTNRLDAELGRNIETDAELRVRREDELRAAGNAATEAIRAAVLEVDGVTHVVVFQNRTNVTDADGIPPKSVEVLVEGGDDTEIAEAIFSSVAAGIGMHGTEEVVVTDNQGIAQTVNFNRPAVVNAYVRIDVVKDPDTFPDDGDDQIKEAIVEWGDAQLVGKNVVASAISAQAFKVTGVLDVTLCYIGTAPSPSSSATIAISTRQVAEYDTSRITVNLSDGTP